MMTYEEAKRILHPDTTWDNIRELTADGVDPVKTIEQACLVACEAIDKVLAMQWVPVSERLPENEKPVLICYISSRGKQEVCTAFHTDGTQNTDDSDYTWLDAFLYMPYNDEKDCYIVPEGWWEVVDFADEFQAVDMRVTHWMPLPEPPKEHVP